MLFRSDNAQSLIKLGCIGFLGDRGADVKRILLENELPVLPIEDPDWCIRVWASILDIWLRLLRKNGWSDLDAVQQRIADLRTNQKNYEPGYLAAAEVRKDVSPAWDLVSSYHLARAAEILGTYLVQGVVDGHFDIREQLEAQFDRAIAAASQGHLLEREVFVRLLARTAKNLVNNSIWTVTRAVNSRVTKFVESMVARGRAHPIFEMLPPQRRSLREKGLLGSGHRSVVVSLPTSSGKTFIAEFRILQALNQFDHEQGWVAYLAPTRALVNQITLRLRRDLGGIGCIVEKVSPALEIDGLEAGILSEAEKGFQFRILVTTPEKLDLMLRGGWEQKIGRPLTLVIVDEAHGLASPNRGLKLELLLATINRECRYAQFLLLTPFIQNGADIASWLAPDSCTNIELGADWLPNDRVIVVAQPTKTAMPGDFSISLRTRHTTRRSLEVPEELKIADNRVLGLTYGQVAKSPGKLAAATAEILQKRGTVILLVDKPQNCWSVAETLKGVDGCASRNSVDLEHFKRFLMDEMGSDFPLVSLLDYGIGVHHAGMSEDTRAIVEWLTEQGTLKVLVATTTIAQGVNFPVSGVVFASHQYPYGIDMPPEDFWNIAGRAGRVDQGDIGIVAFAAPNDSYARKADSFISRSVTDLNSTLIQMVNEVLASGAELSLESLSYRPEWSAFVQYLAHTYRQIGNHERFASEVEQVLRGTYGFQTLRKTNQGWADRLVRSVYSYAERLNGKPLKLVDATGFSWESVSSTLSNLREAGITKDVWSPELFGEHRPDLQRMFGVMLKIPELRESLEEVTGGPAPNGDMLSRIVVDWVHGMPLADMAVEYFGTKQNGRDKERGADPVAAMTKCCRSIFGRLTQTASWGLSAFQSLTLGESFASLQPEDQRAIRNLPAQVYYGVSSDEAVALRLLGVSRTAATPLAKKLGVNPDEPLHRIRARLRDSSGDDWKAAMGELGDSYHRVWSIMEGDI